MVYFAIALHFHQPVGNFTEIFERAYDRCYRPFLEYLPYYPDIKVTLHISGSLLDYLRKAHPEALDLIRRMIKEGQVEIMGGPYYEPILPAIPPRDIKGQISLMSKAIKDEFGLKARGIWIPERVWHPDLVKHLQSSGARYCILDDTHLVRAGLKKEDTHGYFVTGGWLRRIACFPSNKMLRYTIPFRKPQETIDYLKKAGQKKKAPLFLYADDVEKFGEWPGTYEWVYEKGWLKNFFDKLMQNKDWIKVVKLSDYLRSHRPLKRVDIPEASYQEMIEWAGGSWFNFLKKYPEANHMYGKMQYVSSEVEGLQKEKHAKDKDSIYWANVELYRGQCNCGYWHGVFGGLYMYHLRSAIYNHLIAAENLSDSIKHKDDKGWIELKEFDIDRDGRNEFILSNKILSSYFDPKDGGVLKELDYRPICANLVNGISRKKEPYHKEVKRQEPSLSENLAYDKYTRSCLRDYFLKEDVMREAFTSASLADYGNFSNGEYLATKKKDSLILTRKSSVSGVDIELSKEITLKENVIEIDYSLKKATNQRIDILFGTEFNLTMPFLNSYKYRYFSDGRMIGTLDMEGEASNAGSFGIHDSRKELDLNFKFSKKAKEIWYFPVETVSKSQVAYRSNFQCSCMFPFWKPDFDKGTAWDLKITWHIGN